MYVLAVFGMGSAVSCKENMKGPLAWQAVWTDGWSSSDIQGEAPAECMNHRSTNCSPQHVLRIQLTHSLFLWPDKNIVLWKINPSDDDKVLLQPEAALQVYVITRC